ncbi:protein VAC14 homolog [Phalaenopsis equestris]|uniref:protein VAC14 homolog n=1 Tax=Phalaenopsis equestris TaxID=78828 RepID=UPI0009E54E32|nr:protein VAC14 homolog [Phalaenopsis equestris]
MPEVSSPVYHRLHHHRRFVIWGFLSRIFSMSIIPASVLRNLADKLDEKRKNAAYEVGVIVKQFAQAGEHEKIAAVINLLAIEFTCSPQPNHKKGGLLALAAATLALSSEASRHLEEIGPLVINSFIDQDSRVRYFACEALYNIAMVVRGEINVFFNQIFDALCMLSADSDLNVRSAAHLLDRLMRDIVTDSHEISIEEFIPLLRERLNVINPYVRLSLLNWITVLDNVAGIDMLRFLPDFLDGLFNMLSDSSHDIREQAGTLISGFLQGMMNSKNVDFGRVAEILVRRATSSNSFSRQISIKWIDELLKVGGNQLVSYYADILGAILLCISDIEEEVRVVARETNEELWAICSDPAEKFDVGAILSVAMTKLATKFVATRLESLHWIQRLLACHHSEAMTYLNDIFDSLLRTLADPSDEVVLLALEVHACMAKVTQQFQHLVVSLISTFRSNHILLEKRSALIVPRLCVLLDAERVYREFSQILEGEKDLSFASNMVQALNLVLLTSSELTDLRNLLKKSLMDPAGKDLFLCLYSSWCHSPMGIISLCLLAQAYHHASAVIQTLAEEDMNVKFLMQLDKLISLLEAPVFTHLRLQLLDPSRCAWLLMTLYGLLNLLPQQSAAFKILKTRLKTIPPHTLSDDQLKREGKIVNDINFESRLQEFKNMQNRHRMHSRSSCTNSGQFHQPRLRQSRRASRVHFK